MRHTGPPLPAHPGSLLRAKLTQLGCGTTLTAQFLGLSRQTIYEIIGEKQAITPGVALRIGKMTGTDAEMWLNIQRDHDLAVARAEYRDLLEKVPRLEERW